MTKQTKHTRKGFKAGRGVDLGKYKIDDLVEYDNKVYVVLKKRYNSTFNLIIYIIENKKNKEIVEIPEQFIKKVERGI